MGAQAIDRRLTTTNAAEVQEQIYISALAEVV